MEKALHDYTDENGFFLFEIPNLLEGRVEFTLHAPQFDNATLSLEKSSANKKIASTTAELPVNSQLLEYLDMRILKNKIIQEYRNRILYKI